MTALDAKFGALAVKLLAKFGKVVQYSVLGSAAYDVATGRATVATTTTAIKAFVRHSAMDGTPLEESRREILIAGSVVAASQNDRITVDGVSYTVVKNAPVYSGETIALHIITAQQT